ncbi:MAG: LptA/OstA family protein [Terriglobales bacterium]
MPINISRLRNWFAVATIAIVLVVAGFYLYGRLRGLYALKDFSRNKLPVEIQQSTQDFSLSKSEGGRTIFTIRAARAMQFKEGGRAELKDVNIVVYGREANRFDQIYGSDFVYDPQSGNITAQGEVHIDLEGNAEGQKRPDQAPPQELKNPIHVLTSGLVFNQTTGNAVTRERVEFRVPHASGWAQGATYDSRLNQLRLDRDVHITFSGPNPANVVAQHGLLTKEPRRAVLYSARIQRQNATIEAGQLTIFLREDNSMDRILAGGGLRSTTAGATALAMNAPQAVLHLRGHTNDVAFANITGGVSFAATGGNTMSGSADAVRLEFAARNQLSKVRAQSNVKLVQPPQHARNAGLQNAKAQALPSSHAQRVELAADAIDFYLTNGKQLRRAETGGNAQITLTPQNAQPGERTVVTAAKFNAGFNRENRLSSLKGAPDARVLSYAPGQADRISTSESIEVAFGAAGGVSSLVQRGDFHYSERLPNGTERAAWSQTATYSPETEQLTLQGQPRIVEGGMTTTARLVRMNRRSGDATAEQEVKTTYSEVKPQPNGALLASGGPIHVTARSMTAQRATGLAHYAGDARLWQGANIIEAPTIDFDLNKRMVLAQAGKGKRVATVLTQDRNGQQTPISVTSAKLTYVDGQRTVRFEGGVVVRSADGSLTANHVDILLKPAASAGGGPLLPAAGSSQVERIIAEGKVGLQRPKRRATGEKLVYAAAEDRYVLTGGPPSIFDAEHGNITGASLTFYDRDDRVLVEGGGNSRVVTHTRVSR